MSACLLLVTHQEVGTMLMRALMANVGEPAFDWRSVAVYPDDHASKTERAIAAAIQSFGEGAEILVVTDLFGATPSNLAHMQLHSDKVRFVHGLNLAMLTRAHNYADLAADELVKKMVSGAEQSIFAGDNPG